MSEPALSEAAMARLIKDLKRRDPLVYIESGMFVASAIAAGVFLGGWLLVGGLMIAVTLALNAAHVVELRKRVELTDRWVFDVDGESSDLATRVDELEHSVGEKAETADLDQLESRVTDLEDAE